MRKMIGWIMVFVFGAVIVLLVFLGSPSEDADSKTITELALNFALLAAILVSGLMVGFFLVLYDKLCDIAKNLEKNLIMYSFEVLNGGVFFVITTNREEAIETAKSEHGADNISYITESPIDKTPFTFYR